MKISERSGKNLSFARVGYLSPPLHCYTIDFSGRWQRTIAHPFGYILADLILDATVAAKALRHLIRVTAVGHYTKIPTPAPEGPKEVPNLTVPFAACAWKHPMTLLRVKLALIWRCGLEAVKQRMDREEAFSAKVAAIQAAETEFMEPERPTYDHEYHLERNIQSRSKRHAKD